MNTDEGHYSTSNRYLFLIYVFASASWSIPGVISRTQEHTQNSQIEIQEHKWEVVNFQFK